MKRKYFLLSLLATLFAAGNVLAQEISLKTVQAFIKGTSTLHDWVYYTKYPCQR